jgi:hypothetical protein
MKKWIALLILVFAAVVVAAGIQRSRGLGQFVVSDVTQPMQKAIKAPVMPFRNGALFVAVDAQLDGDATLLIISNHGRDRRTEALSGTIQDKIIGGAEEWVDDLVVRFEPGSAKQGYVRILMACGKNLKQIK